MKLIDADALKEKFADILGSTYTDDYAKGFVNGLYAALNMPTITPPNEPLTLEQLREMDGQPVWIVRLEDNLGWWAIVRLRNDRANTDYGAYFMISDYGKAWIAYAYHPGHIDRETWTAEWKDHYKSGVHAGTGAICSSCDVWNERKTHICPFCGKAMDEDGFAMLEKRMGVR